ncbi:MAG: zinc ribbon domain-containing protein [Ruminococcus sp.]|nr:zinc ribbon domain-containing protein [Ruminococcus sp.]
MKNCPDCGAALEKGDRYCGECGGRIKRPILWIAAAVIVVVSAALLIFALRPSGGKAGTKDYTEAIDRYVKVLEKGDSLALRELSAGGSDFERDNAYYREAAEDMHKLFEEELGSGARATYRVTSEKELSAQELEKLEGDFLQGKLIDIEFTYSGRNESRTEVCSSVIVVDTGSGWKFYGETPRSLYYSYSYYRQGE